MKEKPGGEGLQKYFFFFTIVVYVLIITSLSIVVFHKPLDADESQMVGDHLQNQFNQP